jgi:hypothetical protein
MRRCWGLLLIAGCLAASFSSGRARDRGSSFAVDGLDSLTSVTLTRALSYLGIAPEELGFDKLYAEDDTFRLAVVEELLGDPLRIPAWQRDLLGDLRAALGDPGALTGRLGTLCDAPLGKRLDPSHWPAADLIARRTSDEARRQENARDLEVLYEAFIERTSEAAGWIEKAFANLSAEEKRELLVLAPVVWGGEDSAELSRKGQLHREVGVQADTTIEFEEDWILDLAVKVDREALTRGAALFATGVADLAYDGCQAVLPPPARGLGGVEGAIITVLETDWGLFVVGGPGPNTYSPEALRQIAFLVDPGGDDVYRGRAASAVGGLTRPFGAIIDLEGNDLYDASGLSYALGGAVLGVSVLIDAGGNDIYRGEDGVEGAGFFGAGLLFDGGGVDIFEGRNMSQGAGAFGIGVLISECQLPPPPGPELQPDRAYDAGLLKVPGTGAVPIRYDDNDIYQSARYSQGFASTFGTGLLFDRKGSDIYRAGGHYLHAPLRPHDFQALSQGYSIGFRPRAGGGVGILMDEEGNDFYNGAVYAQGAGYWYSIGLLFDGAGNDRYLATQYAQGAGIHLAVGSLWDRGGDDHYVSKFGVTQGTAHDLSVGCLLDESGNDFYVVSDGQAMSITNSVALFVDSQGDDFYATPGGGQGTVTWARGFCGAGIFLDLEGRDTYSEGVPGKDGAVWRQRTYGLGVDLDRDLELPGELVPEIELTAEDSARTVEELFETASIWEVGSAREKVRRARGALIAKEMEAVRYVTRQKLGTKLGLEYRAIAELARAYPDSFSAYVLPCLEDENERVQRNVIGLLGDLKRTEAVEPMTAMLEQGKHREQWNRLIGALGRIGEPEASPSLRPFLRDEEERRRIVTVSALGALKDTASVPALVKMLSDPIFTVRAAAQVTLEGFGVPSVDPLCQSLDSKDADAQRALCLQTLGSLAVALRDSTDAASLRARGQARAALMAELLGMSESSDAAARAAAVEGLIGLGDDETLAFVRLNMKDEYDPLVRRTYEHAIREEE